MDQGARAGYSPWDLKKSRHDCDLSLSRYILENQQVYEESNVFWFYIKPIYIYLRHKYYEEIHHNICLPLNLALLGNLDQIYNYFVVIKMPII